MNDRDFSQKLIPKPPISGTSSSLEEEKGHPKVPLFSSRRNFGKGEFLKLSLYVKKLTLSIAIALFIIIHQ
jgi:hypothetical protein